LNTIKLKERQSITIWQPKLGGIVSVTPMIGFISSFGIAAWNRIMLVAHSIISEGRSG
jgi:Cu/Ag efflux pump CusA